MKLKAVRALLVGLMAVTLTIGAANGIKTSNYQTRPAEQEAARAAVKTAEVLADEADTKASRAIRKQVFVASAGAAEGIEAAHAAEASASAGEAHAENPIAVATVDSYVNMRMDPSTDSEVVGKLYRHSVGTVLGEENGWYLMESGSVTGYVKTEYVLTGAEGQALAEEVGQRLADVTTTTLKVRTEPSTEASVLGLVPEGDTLSVTEELDGWVKVVVEEGEGCVSADYVNVYTKNVEAESREEEEARLAEEEAERQAAEEAARRTAANQNVSGRPSGSGGSTSQSSSGSTSQKYTPQNTAPSGHAALGQQIAGFALQFVGNPYVYGGTSLTNGADCSGFVQSVYKNFGISLPRTSGEQGASGTSVESLTHAQPGDLLWYSGHIGIYIGNGQIVHASTSKTGIIVSNADYRQILSIRRIVS